MECSFSCLFKTKFIHLVHPFFLPSLKTKFILGSPMGGTTTPLLSTPLPYRGEGTTHTLLASLMACQEETALPTVPLSTG